MKPKQTNRDETVLSQLLASLDIAVLERVEQSDRFTSRGVVPPWWVALFGPIDRQGEVLIRDCSAFLDHFLDDAERCWTSHAESLCHSDPWTERIAENKPFILQAIALTIYDRSLILIRRLEVTDEGTWAIQQHREEEITRLAQTGSRFVRGQGQDGPLQDDLLGVLDELGLAGIITDDHGEATQVSTTAAELLGLKTGIHDWTWERLLPSSQKDLPILRAKIRRPDDSSPPLTLLVNRDPPRWIVMEVHAHPRHAHKRFIFLQNATEMYDLRRLLDTRVQLYGLIGNSSAMVHVFQQVRTIAPVDTPVLIEGEAGTGKELVARAIHLSSSRKQGPFIAVNCAGLTGLLLASQLFGHNEGAFAGALSDQMGLFEFADGGTIFLDEIGDISVNVQARILSVLQDKEITRLGDRNPRKVNVRVLAATHRNLKEDAIRGTFLANLLHHICEARITLPPLRDRRDDISLLAYAFLAQFRAATGKQVDHISPHAFDQLLVHAWPGNVRELKRTIEYAALACKGLRIDPEDLPPELRPPYSGPYLSPFVPRNRHDECSRLLRALDQAGGNRSAAARLLGISRATFYRRLAAHKITLSPQ